MKNFYRSKTLILIPIVVFVVIAICMVLNSIMNDTSEGVGHMLGMAGTLGMILWPIPCLVMSIIGTVYASKAKKEGIAKSRIFFVIGMIEIVSIIVSVVVVYMYILYRLFDVAMGV